MKKNEVFSLKEKRFMPIGKILKIMKVLTFLMFVVVIHVSARSYSQNTKLSMNMQNVSIKQVLANIEDQSEFRFLYSDSKINVEKKVDVEFNNKPVEDILRSMFGNSDVRFKVVGRQILLSAVNENINFSDQQKSVSGKVTDSAGVPLPGVSIVIKGTTNGITTDANGKYSILNIPENASLLFSFVGMKMQEIVVGGKTTVNVSLEEDAIGIEEVVAVGYGTMKKVNLSGAVGTVSNKVLENRPIRSIGEGLQGTVAGLNIDMTNGRSSSVPNINIRGYESINGGSPLIIIDGVSSDESELARLNPTDVESMSVLKDAASCAIYGARASFGVLLIKTKSGEGKMTVTYNGGLSFHTASVLPEIITDPYQVMVTKEAAAYPYYTDLYPDEMVEYAKKVSQGLAPNYRLNPSDNTQWQTFASTNWFKEIYRDYGNTQDHNFSISGKENKMTYYFSGAWLDENGIIRHGNDKFERYNLRSKIDFKLTDWLSFGNNTSWENTDYDEPCHQDAWLMFHQINRTDPRSPVFNPDGSYTSSGASMVGGSETNRANTTNSNIQTQLTAEVSLFKNVWKINADYTVRKENRNKKSFGIPVPYKDGPDLPTKYQYNSTYATQGNSTSLYKGINVYTKIAKSFNLHYLSGMLGFNQEVNTYDYFDASKKDLISPSLPTIQLATGNATNSASYTDWAVRGIFSRLNYTYADKYIFEANGRYDGSSRFPKNDRFGFFPSFSIAWRLDKESFMPELPFISSIKPRFSWGSLGNQAVPNYAYIASMSSGKISPILGGVQPNAIYQPGLVASNLTWETVTSQNLGLDISMFKNKLDISIDSYQRLTQDMLTKSKTLPNVLGATEPKENAADLTNKGWELTMSWKSTTQVAGSPLNYSVGFNLSDSRTWISKFDNPDNYLSDYYKGQEIGEIWGLQSMNLFQSAKEVQNHAYQDHLASDEVNYFAMGDVQWKDLDGDGKITNGAWRYGNSGDYTVIGNNQNRYRYGINISAEWKNFDFRLFGQGVGKRDYYPGSGNHYFWGVQAQPWAQVTAHLVNNMWTPNTTDGYFPRLKAYAAEDWNLELGIPQTRYMINAAYLRLKNITVGYSLPKQLLQKINISKVRFYVSGENILTFSDITKYGMDPEVLSGSGDYPMQKKFSLGMNIVF